MPNTVQAFTPDILQIDIQITSQSCYTAAGSGVKLVYDLGASKGLSSYFRFVKLYSVLKGGVGGVSSMIRNANSRVIFRVG